ncbi:MAG: DUF885 domain-containing protein, partial [Proteobacteria bacterium]|nr:DUF885 domain-containing protein [Pseudomonadota bacterium]
PPPLDGSKPGIFYANLRSVREIPKFGMRTLAYHEAIPGHHLQIAIAQELPGLPIFRRVVPFTAYVEGWALYAERLALENGFHPTPYDRLGALQAEVFRAVRLVVDTGIHAQRWTREQAIETMVQNTGMPETDVVAEVERYIVSPGQACAYKVGQLAILSLRDRAQRALGPRFDPRAFHDVVLGQGAAGPRLRRGADPRAREELQPVGQFRSRAVVQRPRHRSGHQLRARRHRSVRSRLGIRASRSALRLRLDAGLRRLPERERVGQSVETHAGSTLQCTQGRLHGQPRDRRLPPHPEHCGLPTRLRVPG